jgi:hypothetical protein
MSRIEIGRSEHPVFKYKGKDYRVTTEGGIVVAADRSHLPTMLSRVVTNPIKFDKNGILSPQNPRVTNDMVSMAHPDDWEKFARMFKFGKEFQVISIDSTGLVGPTFLAGNRLLIHDEILGLVPKSAIQEVAVYTWGPAEEDYDYQEGLFPYGYERDFYQRVVLANTRGMKPIQTGLVQLP